MNTRKFLPATLALTGVAAHTTASDGVAPLHAIRFPGESAAYRRARDELLRAEIALRGQIEAVAAQRRALPVGGAVAEDYVFEEGTPGLDDTVIVRSVRLSELFAAGKPSLIVYSFMYGPDMLTACPMCTALLDSLNGSATHVAQRANLVVVAKSPIKRVRAFARERGWNQLRLLSSAGNRYNADYRGETAAGAQMPTLNVFVQNGNTVRHSYNAELLFAPGNAGHDPRHVDSIWPLWNLFDFIPQGRGADWYPGLGYPP